ncbi:MAG: assimilatory sulfite reductase (NADPH) flavoprotein subunit [Rudaea sp.]
MSAEPIHTLIPFPDDKAAMLARLVEGLDRANLHWLSGYAAGLAAQPANAEPEPIAAPGAEAATHVTVLYGSQTGNAKRLAEKLARQIESAGLSARLLRADAYPLRELKSERFLYIVISTQGDGDPPEDSRGFVEFLTSKRAPTLDNLKFSVLGLGDSSYAKFCAVGMQIDARLKELGATRLFERGDADLDIDSVATPWLQSAATVAREQIKSAPVRANVTPLWAARTAATWTRERPFSADVLANQRISATNGTKDIRHIELSLGDSGLVYEPGDSIGVWPTNPPHLVADILDTLKLDPQSIVTHADETLPLERWLSDKRELTRLARPLVVAHAARARQGELDGIVASPESLQPFLKDRQFIDLLRAYPANWDAASLVAALNPLTPRLYSIASSLKFAENEVHLTVAHLDYDAFGHSHVGAASHFLATRDEENRIPIYVESNDRFRLPRDASRDVIMIGPGTGVAPFRAFVQERAAIGARGRNWLFFGNPHFRSDFLYQIEWQAALKRGELHKIDLAFSRDQAEKVYVQHTLRRRGRALFDWLEGGAHVYVCGDATHMAKDVHAALREVIVEHGGKSVEDAEAYLSQLAADRRYCRDVY